MLKNIMVFVIVLLLCSISLSVQAQIVTLLDDYSSTGDINDVVHLGDNAYDYLIKTNPQGTSWNFNFNLTEIPVPGSFTVHIDSFYANPDLGYYDHVYLNGSDLGYLSAGSTWVANTFIGDSSLLRLDNNVLTIDSANVSSNYDDFEFTNVYVNVAPEPFSSTLFIVGGATLGFRRFRKKFKK